MSHEFTRATTEQPAIISQTTKANFELTDAKAEIPFSLYSGETNHTYTEEFFKITDEWHNPDSIKLLEDYIFNQIGKQNLNDSIKSYEALIQDLFAKIGVNENETEQSKFDKVIKFINLIARNKSKDERQRELLKRQKEVEKVREERRQALLKNNLDKAKEEKANLKKELETKSYKLSELEKAYQTEAAENQANQERIERLMAMQRQRIEDIKDLSTKSLQHKAQLEAENERLYKELHEAKLREQILLEKHNKLKQFIQ